MSKTVVIQSNYIPWKGYFDMVRRADHFVVYDDVQYTKNDWRNRNKIVTAVGVQWITIPVIQAHLDQKIKDTKVADPFWAKKHWKTLSQAYAKAPFFKQYRDLFEKVYRDFREEYLSPINLKLITVINDILGVKTVLSSSGDYDLKESDPSARLVEICTKIGTREYITGPAAKNYLREELFAAAGIRLTYMDYSGYPEYHQLISPFTHEVSILDLIFNEGPNATRYMKTFAPVS
ncbi:MAG TPA: WbqC family protein [Candidatus Omnitrophota bacterium]|nr:WbqC family protein [Candidatus Omnitrophota bacterium]HPS36566.1 WbqC family protein [Candidatus Omnitrophota bacterium]